MTTPTLLERYSKQIVGTRSCFDRLIISGSLPDCGHAGVMTPQLIRRQMRIFDYANLVNPLRNRLHDNARLVAQEAGITIEVIRKAGSFRKEDRIAEIVKARGSHPGLVHVFSTMETCSCFKPWRDKATGKTALRPAPGRCSHYYFYFLDEIVGLCYLRVPTWAPFRLQFYCNGHSWLAGCLRIVGELMAASNRRYLDILSALEDDASGRRDIDRVTKPVRDETGRSHRGINFFDARDLALALSLVRGEYGISGVTVRWLRRNLPSWNGSQIARALRRFREHKLLKKVHGTFKYYVTQMGRKLILAALRLRETLIIPALA